MVESQQIVYFDEGELETKIAGKRSHEAVLVLPLRKLIVRVVDVPVSHRNELEEYCKPFLQEMSPFVDEELTVSCEIVRECEDYCKVIAAAFPEGDDEELANALDEAHLDITRIDALSFGALRNLLPEIINKETGKRRLFLCNDGEYIDLFVFEDDAPIVIRVVSAANLRREVMFSLLTAEDSVSNKGLDEIVYCGDIDVSSLEGLSPIRQISEAEDPFRGIAERSEDSASLNVLPAAWQEVLRESRLKRSLKVYLSLALTVWVLIMGVLFGVPYGYGVFTDKEKAKSRSHRSAFSAVKNLKSQVEAVRNVSNHDLGALETLRTVVGMMGEGIELTRWNFKRGDELIISGTANDKNTIYEFKDNLSNALLTPYRDESDEENEESEAKTFFKSVAFRSDIRSRGSQYTFEIACSFVEKGEDE